MSLSDLFSGRAAKERRAREAMAARLNGQALKCISERLDDGETIIARNGAIVVRDRVLTVYGGTDPVFSVPVAELTAGELMSRDGIVFQIPDGQGGERRIVCYYQYWRPIEP